MQQFVINFGAALLALLVLALPALAYRQHWTVMREDWRQPLRLLFGILAEELGSSIVYNSNISYPVGCTVAAFVAGATAPTLAQVQASQVPTQNAQIFWADGDGAVTVTHNWGAAGLLGSTNAIMLANAAFIQASMVKVLGGASDSSFATNFTYGLTANTNSITITKVGVGTGQGGTYQLTLRLPYSASF
jgi:hypothetical protein